MKLKTIFSLTLAALIGSAPAFSAEAAETRVLQMETPWQMTGQVATGIAGALTFGIIGAGIGESRAKKHCMETIDPDFSDECGWSALGGAMLGGMIGIPIGHALGALTAGLLQDKQGAPLAAASAIVGDLGMVLLAITAHNLLDGKIAANGKLDAILIPVTVGGMIAIPVITQSVADYKLRIGLQPNVSLGATPEETRYALQLAQLRF